MDKLAAMHVFVEIATRGSLTAAGKAMGKSLPTMVRTLANLEEALGVRLIRRTTRRMSLTDEGRDYLERCRRILVDVDEAERALLGGSQQPRGQLRVTAPVNFGSWHVAPAATAFVQRYRQVQLSLILLDRVTNLLEEGFDVAVRIGVLADSSLIARNVGSMRRVVVASPGYLDRAGLPSHPTELSDGECVCFSGITASATWRFYERGRTLSVPVRGSLACNQAIASVEACAAGLGFGQFLSYQVAPFVQAGTLRIVLAEYEPPLIPVSLVYTEARFASSRLRLFLDWMQQRLRDNDALSLDTLAARS